MGSFVDHRARKREIVVKAIRTFAQVGYRDVTLQMLADRSGVARTVLYRYFRNKRQIFDCAILEITRRIAAKHREIALSSQSCSVRLRQLATAVTATLFDNREFLSVIIDFVTEKRRAGVEVAGSIAAFTGGLKRVLRALVAEGRHRGEFAESVDPTCAAETFYAMFESTVLRLTVSDDAVMADAIERLDGLIERMKK